MSSRRTDLDGLRIVICGCVVAAHAMLIFAVEPFYHIKSAEPSPSATIAYEYVRATSMALFFIIAGWAGVVALRRRSPVQFVKERFTRLFVPLAFGTVVFGWMIRYIEHSQGRHVTPTAVQLITPTDIGLLAYFPKYISRLNHVTWSHLWFLAYLIVISLLLLPLLMRLARVAPSARVPAAPVVYMPAALLAAVLVALDGYWPFVPSLYHDRSNFLYFALCFAIGAGIAVWPGFEARIRTEAPRLLLLMLLFFCGVIFFGESTLGRVCVGLTAWCAAGAALGFAARIDPVATPTFLYLSEATMTIYVIHHLPLLVFGVLVLPLAWPVWIKIAAITAATFAVSFTAYHFVIRNWDPLRVITGMPPARK